MASRPTTSASERSAQIATTVSGPDAQLAQVARQAVGARVESAVGQALDGCRRLPGGGARRLAGTARAARASRAVGASRAVRAVRAVRASRGARASPRASGAARASRAVRAVRRQGHHRHRLGNPPHLLLEQLVQAGVAAPGGRRVVPLQAAAGAPPPPAAAARRSSRPRWGRHRREQRLEMAGQPPDRGGVEEVAAVLERQRQPARPSRTHRASDRTWPPCISTAQSSIASCAAVSAGCRAPRRALCSTSITWNSGVERQIALRRQRLDQLLEGQILVGVGRQARLPHPPQQARGSSAGRRGRRAAPGC